MLHNDKVKTGLWTFLQMYLKDKTVYRLFPKQQYSDDAFSFGLDLMCCP